MAMLIFIPPAMWIAYAHFPMFWSAYPHYPQIANVCKTLDFTGFFVLFLLPFEKGLCYNHKCKRQL
jgi:hypothetical protein